MSFLEIGVNIISSCIEAFGISYLILVLVNLINKSNSITTRNKFAFLKLCIILFAVFNCSSFIHIYLSSFNWMKSILFTIATALGCVYCFKIKLYKGIITSILIAIIAAILEMIIVLVLNFLNIAAENIVTNFYYYRIYACSLAIIEAGLGFLIYKTSIMFNKNLASVDNKLNYFIPQLIAIIICLFPSMILLVLNYYEHSALFIFINLMQLLVVSFVGIYNLKFVAKHENTELELANTIVYNETLKKVNEGVRGFKHDMGNIVQAILGYIAINDSEGAKKYCQNLVIGFNDINVLSILSPKVIDDPAIYGVVVNKILVARDKNMTLSLDINTSVSEINFPKFELSRILGILLDNAIEAGEQTDTKKLILNMYHDYSRNVDVIVISNSTNNVDIDIAKIFTKNYSTKENPSGFGLYEINKFLKQNPQGYITTTIDKNAKLFTQTLTIDSKLKLIQTNNTEESTVA